MASGRERNSITKSVTPQTYERELDERLTESYDGRYILDWLDEATPQWQHIGVQLGLKGHEIDTIKQGHPHDPKMCFHGVITKRLQKGDLTWEILLQTLELDSVGRKQLALKINERLRDPNLGHSYVHGDGRVKHTHRVITTINGSEVQPLPNFSKEITHEHGAYHEPTVQSKKKTSASSLSGQNVSTAQALILPAPPAPDQSIGGQQSNGINTEDKQDEVPRTNSSQKQKREKVPTGVITIARKKNELMGEDPSYHQSITAVEAEKRLKKCGDDCCYLTRYSESNKSYVLSVCQKRPTPAIKHFGIDVQGGKCNIRGNQEEMFDDITQMLRNYEQKRLDPAFRTIGTSFTEENYNSSKGICSIL